MCVSACRCANGGGTRVGGWRSVAYWSLWASCEVRPLATGKNLDPGFERHFPYGNWSLSLPGGPTEHTSGNRRMS